MAKVKCVVNHPNLHLAVAGKLQKVKKDGVIEVEEKHVQRHLKNGNLKRYGDSEVLKVGADDTEALVERAKALNIANPGKMKPETLKAKIAEAEKAIAEANAAAGQQ